MLNVPEPNLQYIWRWISDACKRLSLELLFLFWKEAIDPPFQVTIPVNTLDVDAGRAVAGRMLTSAHGFPLQGSFPIAAFLPGYIRPERTNESELSRPPERADERRTGSMEPGTDCADATDSRRSDARPVCPE